MQIIKSKTEKVFNKVRRDCCFTECVQFFYLYHGEMKLTDICNAEFLKFVRPREQKIMRSANNVSPHVRQTFLNDVFTFLTEVGNAGLIVNTGTSSFNSEFATALNT